ncbi:MAG: integral rane protein [Mycobacterium sp.]|jgi:hypothetical protein|nr:integral rane protein [Mycobacterium sp.]
MNWFWHALWICLVIIPVTLLWIVSVIDIVVRRDLSGWSRVGWLLLIFVLPLFGAAIYFFMRPLVDRTDVFLPESTRATSATAGTEPGKSLTQELDRITYLHTQGTLTDSEFATAKRRLLNTTSVTV